MIIAINNFSWKGETKAYDVHGLSGKLLGKGEKYCMIPFVNVSGSPCHTDFTTKYWVYRLPRVLIIAVSTFVFFWMFAQYDM